MFPKNTDVIRRPLVQRRKRRTNGRKILRAKVGGMIWKREMGDTFSSGVRGKEMRQTLEKLRTDMEVKRFPPLRQASSLCEACHVLSGAGEGGWGGSAFSTFTTLDLLYI